MDFHLLAAVLAGIAVLLFLIVWLKIPAFLALLSASILVGLLAGQPPEAILKSCEKGMGGTLGYVALVVGLGAIFGGILEKTGGAQAIAQFLLRLFGERNAPSAMAAAGLVIAIPVFFDVAFIILCPVLLALNRRTGRSILVFALPLLAGLAVGHAFIPPTPGPIAVAQILGADLGRVIAVGLAAGIPATVAAGIFFGKWAAEKVAAELPSQPFFDKKAVEKVVGEVANNGDSEVANNGLVPPIALLLAILFLPIFLILMKTASDAAQLFPPETWPKKAVDLLGHPFSALLAANAAAWCWLGLKRGLSAAELADISQKSLAPAGAILLVTGAGGCFKQILIDTRAGEMLAQSAAGAGISVVVFAFLAALAVRVLQGSATVAMATAASLTAPLLASAAAFSPVQLAALTVAIASGASAFSHVNDSGFWLVKSYLGLTEGQTFRTWTLMTTVLAAVGFAVAAAIFWLF